MEKHPENISDHITYADAVRSAKALKLGIENKPNAEQLKCMQDLGNDVFEPLRTGLGDYPIGVSSFFRSVLLNASTKGSSNTSQHCKGQAIDIYSLKPKNYTNSDIFHFIRKHLEFDQLIWEHGTNENPNWVHVSYVKGKNRKQILIAYSIKEFGKDVTKYKPYVS